MTISLENRYLIKQAKEAYIYFIKQAKHYLLQHKIRNVQAFLTDRRSKRKKENFWPIVNCFDTTKLAPLELIMHFNRKIAKKRKNKINPFSCKYF